eukprot:TRINITY_DN3014_c0_g2_i1.p1 TRINITY_DN3014_c0_g2~~TRINITY_DN3014_c0_g2_i1.p1  ORF type:complete len:674 (+),score=237.00 TRINITY_DN3014_c0_g2_i1:547-2568(+)
MPGNVTPCVLPPVEEPEGELEEEAWVMLAQGVMVALAFLSVKLVHRFKVPLMTECGSVILTGFLFGGLLHLIKPSFGQAAAKFPAEAFFLVILPPIIFEAGFSLTSSKSSLSSNTGTILLLAIAGTMISTLIVGSLLFLLFGPLLEANISLWECFAFGALISAVDPVATLAVLSEVFPGAKPGMFYLVFGESVINDAVSIVLYTVCEGVLKLENNNEEKSSGPVDAAAGAFAVFLKFWGVFLGSILVGIIMTLLTSFFLKVVDLRDHPTIELVTVLLSAMSTYSIAQAVDLSGIMAIFVAGRLMKHWSLHNVSVANKIFLPRLIKAISETAELYVFAFLGSAFWTTGLKVDVPFILATFAAILLGRAANIFPLCFLSNQFRSENSDQITAKEQIFMWFSGLRGAIAFALACYGTNTGVLKNGDRLITTTLVTVMFTVFVFGGFAKPLLVYLELAPSETRQRRRSSGLSHEQDEEDDDHDDAGPDASRLLDPLTDNHMDSHEALDLFDEDVGVNFGATFGPPPTYEDQSCCAGSWRRFRQKTWRLFRGLHEADVRYIKPFVCMHRTQADLRRERVVQKLLREGVDHSGILLSLKMAQRGSVQGVASSSTLNSPNNDVRFEGISGRRMSLSGASEPRLEQLDPGAGEPKHSLVEPEADPAEVSGSAPSGPTSPSM